MNNKCLEFDNWLAVAIGNSRLHWAWFKQDVLIENWHTSHLPTQVIATPPLKGIAYDEQETLVKFNQLPQQFLSPNFAQKNLTQIPIYLASVVPQQTKIWQNYTGLNLITLKDIGLKNIYPTMGIDRALAAWGAGETYNYPCLIIDGGTALTFTGVDQHQQLVGGAILSGLRSQLTGLKQKTAALPEITLPKTLPPRWALNTDQAIASGIIYTIIEGIHSYIVNWKQQFPNSQVILTGGDANLLAQYLHLQFPKIAQKTIIDQQLIFLGIKLVCQQQKNT